MYPHFSLLWILFRIDFKYAVSTYNCRRATCRFAHLSRHYTQLWAEVGRETRLGCLFPACACVIVSHVPCSMLWLSKRLFSLPFAFQFRHITISFSFSAVFRTVLPLRNIVTVFHIYFFEDTALFRSYTWHGERLPFGNAVMALLL